MYIWPSQNNINVLNARPKAATDFLSGSTTALADVSFEFGQNIGYNSNSNCTSTGGAGYWPPWPVCPENLSRTGYFPNSPEPATVVVKSGLGAMGYWVNGTSIYQWGDGQSYNNEGVWQTLAAVAELYDVDVCGGHAANGDYHHHFSTGCLEKMVNDEGTGHSPIYGYAADGYAIYGPWHSNGVLAKSSWVVRDYANVASEMFHRLQPAERRRNVELMGFAGNPLAPGATKNLLYKPTVVALCNQPLWLPPFMGYRAPHWNCTWPMATRFSNQEMTKVHRTH